MFFHEHITNISNNLLIDSIENIDLISAYYLGIKTANPTSEILPDLEKKITQLLDKKKGLKFISKILSLTGSFKLTPHTKERLLQEEDPVMLIGRINDIAGKKEVKDILTPIKDRFLHPEFHGEFLSYEEQAHLNVVDALIKRLCPIAKALSSKPFSVSTSKKSNLFDLYRDNSVGKTFISVDIKQANWTSLKHWDSTLPEWSTFLQNHLPEGDPNIRGLFLKSKIFRQITLGVALKKHGIVKLIEHTQVMLIKEAIRPLVKRLKGPDFESNDEAIFSWRQPRGSALEKWLLQCINLNVFSVKRVTFVEKTYDDCFVVRYNVLNDDQEYTLLRCASPKKIESRLEN